MRPLVELAHEQLQRVRGVFADIDDTLTTHGRLTAQAYASLEQLHTAGYLVVPVTGRPAGWCDHIARMWPVDAVVGENGAFWYRYHPNERKMERRYMADADTRATERDQLAAVGREIVGRVPGAAIAADQAFRVADLAIDFCEDVVRLPTHSVDLIVTLMRNHGLNAKVSSIHINGWYGRHDKLTTTRVMLRESFGVDLDERASEFLFVGDSPNDQPMFRYFPCSIGVANVRDFASQLDSPPAFVTDAAAGAGFAEVVRFLLQDRENQLALGKKSN